MGQNLPKVRKPAEYAKAQAKAEARYNKLVADVAGRISAIISVKHNYFLEGCEAYVQLQLKYDGALGQCTQSKTPAFRQQLMQDSLEYAAVNGLVEYTASNGIVVLSTKHPRTIYAYDIETIWVMCSSLSPRYMEVAFRELSHH